MDDYQRAFQDLKAYLTIVSLLSPSMLGEELYLYLAITPYAVSSALVRKEEKCRNRDTTPVEHLKEQKHDTHR